MKKFIKLLCLGLALVFISGCESKDSMEDITIYTSMYPIEYVPKALPIIEPSIVFFGDTFSINLCLPNNFPPKSANVSVKIVINSKI